MSMGLLILFVVGRRNVTLLKDSMKVTARREREKGEREMAMSTRLEGWALYSLRF